MILIRKFEKDDLPQILNIERVSFKFPYDYFTFYYFFVKEPDGFYVAENGDSGIVGYIITYIRGVKGIIVSIAIKPEFKRKNIGSELLKEGLRCLFKKVKEVELQVRLENKVAIIFYKKFGFKEVEQICNYYQDGEDALLMSKFVNDQP